MTDQDLLTELQYVVLEPPDGGASWPSEIWTRLEVLDGLNSAIAQLLRDTQLTALRVEIPVLANAIVVALPVDWMATCTIVWRALNGTRTPLGPVDSYESDLALPSWETVPNTPIGFAALEGDSLTLKLVPTPLANGTLELLYVQRPPALMGAGLALPIPDEFASGVKYNTLSWMFSKAGRLMDPDRATYCDKRYQITTIAAEIILGGWA